MTYLVWLIAAALVGSASLVRYEDCEKPPPVKHASVQIEDDSEDTVRATYVCGSGFTLQGNADLICEIDTDEWNADPPICVQADDASNEVEQQQPKKKRLQDIVEDQVVSAQLAATLDVSCMQAKVKAPEIRHGFVQKYDYRRKAKRVFLVALYACIDNFELEDSEIVAVYCSEQKWVGDLPACVALGEYGDEDMDEEEEGAEEEDNEYGEYETFNEREASNTGSVAVGPPPPPPPTQLIAATKLPSAERPEDGDDTEPSNEIEPNVEEQGAAESQQQEQQPPALPTNNIDAVAAAKLPTAAEPEVTSEEDHKAVTDVNIVIEATHDPFTPRVLDAHCGPDKGGCAQRCERLLFPGENEPRLKCSCFDGFSLDPYDYTSCHDIDECQLDNGGCEQICDNLSGSYQCGCAQGLQIDTLTGHTCVDINECLLRNGHGPCQDSCHNLWPGYRCTCAELPGTRLAADNHTCEDDGGCARRNGGCSHICLSAALGRVICLCPDGFRMSANGGTCQDINECDLPELVENCNGGCENTPGSYRCIPALSSSEAAVATDADGDESDEDAGAGIIRETAAPCAAGYRAATAGGGCVDIDECLEVSSGCEHCVNTNGAFECICPPGFDLADDGHHCVDVNECAIVIEDSNEQSAPHKVCSDECANTPGSFVCSCRPHRHLLADGRSCAPDTCTDLNSPQLNRTRCAFQCVDLSSGQYECVCPNGYQLSADLHNCEVVENGCTKEGGYERCAPGSCRSSEDNSSFSCVCPPGYANEVYSCRDVDECATGGHACSHECSNTEGGYRCSCPAGHRFAEGSDHLCVDIDECQSTDAADLCGTLNCVNRPGDFICLCADGLAPSAETGACRTLDPCAENACSHKCILVDGARRKCICPEDMELAADGASCIYADPCAVGNNGCKQLCLAGEDGACGCQSGFTLAADGKSCADIDECRVANGGCHQLCINSAGGYRCGCRRGFDLLEGFAELGEQRGFCLDVDECALGLHNCGKGQRCENLNGSFTCLCPAGFALGLPPVQARPLLLLAPPSLAPSGQSQSPVELLFAAPPLALSCLDIDECSIANGNCSHRCFNEAGGFACACPDGFRLATNGRDCVDIDECAHGYGNCTFICINLLGSYTCACEAGFELATDQRTCLDIDECALGRHDCSHECVNIDAGYKCVCPAGYLLDERHTKCVDVDECADATQHGCSHTCTNALGSYECVCPADHALAGDSRTCVPLAAAVDGCAANNGGCSHHCLDAGAGCACPDGWALAGDGKTCQDVDECVTRPALCQYSCVNTEGSYECHCPAGYRVHNGRECVDVDECAVDNGGCLSGTCVNHNGGHECRCSADQRLADDRRSCERHTELRDQCAPLVAPLNGEIHCTKYRHKKKLFYNTKCKVWCNRGYQLQGPSQRFCNASGKWDDHENLCQPIVCPRIAPPPNGLILPTTCSISNTYMGERCRLQCRPGHVPLGKSVTVCMANQQWSFNGTFECVAVSFTPAAMTTTRPFVERPLAALPSIALPPPPPSATHFFNKLTPLAAPHARPQLVGGGGVARPYIKCPRNTTVFLGKGERTTHIILQKPVTNLDYRYIQSHPAWTKDLQAHLTAGTYVMTFRGEDPATGLRARCQTVLNVRQAAPPALLFCTSSFEVKLKPNQAYRSVVWKEPRFEAKTKLKKLYQSRIPGELFGPGVHTVYYEATNEDELTSRCEFKILVKVSEPTPTPPIPMIDLRYPSTGPIIGPHGASLINGNLLPGHESFIICPGRAPVKVTHAQSVELPVDCILKNVRVSPLRQYSQRRLFSTRWTPFSSF